jgi:hypothetical protein
MANPNQDARDGHGHYIRTPETAARDARAAELRAEGWKLQDIAAELGYASKTSAIYAIRRVLREMVTGPGEKLVAYEAERLDTLYEAALEVLLRDHVTVSHGKVITMVDPETQEEKPLLDDGPKLAAIDRLVKVRESYRRLLGLDAEKKIAVSGSVKYEVVGVDVEDLK